jgi:hypothetical protein
MLLDLRDPASIVAWVKWAPERHWPQLRAMVAINPKFRPQARAAQELLRAERAQVSA